MADKHAYRNGWTLISAAPSEKADGFGGAPIGRTPVPPPAAKMMWKAEPIQIKTTLTPRLQQMAQNLSMVYLTLTQTLNPLMVRGAHKIAHETGRPFLSSTIVLNTEVVKLAMSCFILIFSNGLEKFFSDLSCAFFKNKRETLKVCVPALIYVVQNNLYFFALKRVEATLFSISYQLRILTTAVLSMLLLRRVFSRLQWGALCISLLGVCLVQLGGDGKGGGGGKGGQARDDEQQQFLGLLTVFVMCWTSAFAGVYLEGVLKQSACDIWMQNIRLSVITLPFALLTIANDADQIEKNGFLSGWNWLLWTIVLTSSSSGLVVAAVMKYADNIKKSYCQSVALGGTALLSIVMGDSQFSWGLLAGVSLVIASVFIYTLNPPKAAKMAAAAVNVPEKESLLDELDTSEEEDEEEEGRVELRVADGRRIIAVDEAKEERECGNRGGPDANHQKQLNGRNHPGAEQGKMGTKVVKFKMANEEEEERGNSGEPGAQQSGAGQPLAQVSGGQLGVVAAMAADKH